jgi:ATP adenylyltransferase
MTDEAQSLIVHRGPMAYVIMNRYPYTSGHVLVVPYQHSPTLEQLSPKIRSEMIELANRAVNVIGSEYNAQGFNVGFNIGEAAGAGIAGHIHMHVVPRWNADTNFMSALSNTRVLPEALEVTYQRLRQAWKGN